MKDDNLIALSVWVIFVLLLVVIGLGWYGSYWKEKCAAARSNVENLKAYSQRLREDVWQLKKEVGK